MMIKLRLSDSVNTYDFAIEASADGVDIREDGEGRCLADAAKTITLEADHCEECEVRFGGGCSGVREKLTLTVSRD